MRLQIPSNEAMAPLFSVRQSDWYSVFMLLHA